MSSLNLTSKMLQLLETTKYYLSKTKIVNVNTGLVIHI